MGIDKYETRRTRHYQQRAGQRSLRTSNEEFVMAWGRETQAAGAVHMTVLRRDLPGGLRDSREARRAEGWIIVLSEDGALLSCYRRMDAPAYLRRKSQRRWRRCQMPCVEVEGSTEENGGLVTL